jgi:hypothetical protein
MWLVVGEREKRETEKGGTAFSRQVWIPGGPEANRFDRPSQAAKPVTGFTKLQLRIRTLPERELIGITSWIPADAGLFNRWVSGPPAKPVGGNADATRDLSRHPRAR